MNLGVKSELDKNATMEKQKEGCHLDELSFLQLRSHLMHEKNTSEDKGAILHWNGPLKPWKGQGMYKNIWNQFWRSECMGRDSFVENCDLCFS